MRFGNACAPRSLALLLATIGVCVCFNLIPIMETGADGETAATLIVAGTAVGPARLSSNLDTVLNFFPLKDIDHEQRSGVRSSIEWLDLKGKNVQGEIRFYFHNGELFQVESASERYRTAEGVTLHSTPESVKKYYKNLKAFLLWNSGGKEVGGKDLIFWVDRADGIAFELYYDNRSKRRLVYHICVFQRRTEFFPGGEYLPTARWRVIPPYSVEAPADVEPPPLR